LSICITFNYDAFLREHRFCGEKVGNSWLSRKEFVIRGRGRRGAFLKLIAFLNKIPFVLAAPDSLGNLECLNFHSIKQAPGFQKHKGVALLQLNEVALGKQYRTSNADSSLNAAALTKKGLFRMMYHGCTQLC